MKPEVRVDEDGTKKWYLRGKLHREDGPAEEWADGTKIWRVKGKIHRGDGPAIVSPNGTKRWFLNDTLHREDGPAVICPDGYKEWFLNGRRLSKEDFKSLDQIIKMGATELFTPQEIVRMRNEII